MPDALQFMQSSHNTLANMQQNCPNLLSIRSQQFGSQQAAIIRNKLETPNVENHVVVFYWNRTDKFSQTQDICSKSTGSLHTEGQDNKTALVL